MNKFKIVIPIAVCLLFINLYAVPASTEDEINFHRLSKVKVLTWNVYLGFDIFALLQVPGEELPGAIAAAISQLLENNFPARAQAMMQQLIYNSPDLIAFQEVWRFEIPHLPFPPPNPTPLTLDYLEILQSLLAGLGYVQVAVNELTDITVPFGSSSLRLVDRDVIFVKRDVNIMSTNTLDYTDTFKTVLPAPFNVVIESKRGLVEAVVEKNGNIYRLVNTHLEIQNLPAVSFTPLGPVFSEFPAQVLQAQELVSHLDGETLSIILAGDFNALPEDEVSSILEVAGLIDMYPRKILGRRGPGFTCCQNEDLQNIPSLLDERIDYIRVRNDNGELPFTLAVPLIARVIGDRPRDRTKTEPRLWPSDHGGLRMTLIIPMLDDDD